MAQGGAVGELITRLGRGAAARRPARRRGRGARRSVARAAVLAAGGRAATSMREGRAVELPEDDPSARGHEGRPRRRVHRRDRPRRARCRSMSEHVQAVGAAAALALENERLDAELRAKIGELRSSRERMLRIGLEERRRLERDLHDGAQQRLVSMALNIRLARAKLNEDPLAAEQLLASAGSELDSALEELRELARGIHPAVLTDRGLGTALETLANRAPGAGRARGASGRAPAGGGGAGRLLRGRRGAHERGEVLEGLARDGAGGARERPRARGGGRRRDRRRRSRPRDRPARARRPARGARGPARGGVRAGPGTTVRARIPCG